MKRREEDTKPFVWQLKSILPAGEENALAAIDEIVAIAKQHPEEGLEWVDDFRDWIAIQLEAEYRGIRRNYYELGQKRRREERAAVRKAARAK